MLADFTLKNVETKSEEEKRSKKNAFAIKTVAKKAR